MEYQQHHRELGARVAIHLSPQNDLSSWSTHSLRSPVQYCSLQHNNCSALILSLQILRGENQQACVLTYFSCRCYTLALLYMAPWPFVFLRYDFISGLVYSFIGSPRISLLEIVIDEIIDILLCCLYSLCRALWG